MSLYIHFLNGPLQRQSLLLPEGNLVFGMSGDSDISLPLEGGIEQFVLSVDGDVVEQVTKEICRVAGSESSTTPIPHDVPVDIGGCRFILSLSECMPELLPASLTPSATVTKKMRMKSPVLGGLMGLILVAIVVSFFWFRTSDSPINSPGNVQRWAEREQATNLHDIQLRWTSGGQVAISGYYREQKVIQPLLQRLKNSGVPYQLMAFSEEDLHDSLRYLAAQNGFEDLKITRGIKPGSVEISGSIIADNNWRRFLDGLQEIEGLNGWHVQNLTMMNTAELLRLVKELNLLGLVSIERHKQIYTITGLLSEAQRDALNNGIEELTGRVKGRIYFQNMSPASPSDSVFPQPVTSVGGSKTKPFIELADGRRLQPGARLSNNYEVVGIDAKRGIDLLGDDQLLHYTFNF